MDFQQVPASFLGWERSTATTTTSALAAAAMAARYAVPAAATAGSSSTEDGGGAAVRFRRAVYRVLIALSFKSFRRRNETKRRRERSDCSEARFLPVVPTPLEDDTLAPEDDIQYVAAVRAVLFCSLAVLDPRVGHTTDVLSPFIPVLCYSD